MNRDSRASIEFVALERPTGMRQNGASALKSRCEQARYPGNMNGQMKNDLDHIEDGAFRSNFRRYSHETYTIEGTVRAPGRSGNR